MSVSSFSLPLLGLRLGSDTGSSGLDATAAFAAVFPYSISISEIRLPRRNCFAALSGAYSSLTSALLRGQVVPHSHAVRSPLLTVRADHLLSPRRGTAPMRSRPLHLILSRRL